MSVLLSHREALGRARQAGSLVAELHGPPDLVIGIRKGGLPVAMAFAQGAGAARTTFVTRCAQTRPGLLAILSRWGRRLVPLGLRKLGRSVLYRPAIALLMKLQGPGTGSAPFIEEEEQLREWLSAAGSVVVVDDAIDSGVTMRRLVATIQSAGPHLRIITFALTSTLGLTVHEPQHHLFEDVVEYVEGDLGLLDEAATARILGESGSKASTGADPRRLEARLQDVLTRPLHECVARALAHALELSGHHLAGFGMRVRCALWRLGQLSHDAVMDDLHRCHNGLSDAARQAFGAALATELNAALLPLAREVAALASVKVKIRVAQGHWVASPAARALTGAEVLAVDQ